MNIFFSAIAYSGMKNWSSVFMYIIYIMRISYGFLSDVQVI